MCHHHQTRVTCYRIIPVLYDKSSKESSQMIDIYLYDVLTIVNRYYLQLVYSIIKNKNKKQTTHGDAFNKLLY